MRGNIALIMMAALAPIAPLTAQQLPQQLPQQRPSSAPAPTPEPPPEPTTESVIALGSDIPGRMTVPVTIGNTGPYPFTIDTGAERSVISTELVGLLKLPRGKPVRVTTITESGSIATAVLPTLTVSNIRVDRIEAPIFRGSDLGAPGLLGLDMMAGHAVRIDFEANEMRLMGRPVRPPGFGSSPDEIIIRARSQFRQLVVTNAYVRGRRVRVILDTGTAVSLGNSALRELVDDGRGPTKPITLTSVTGKTLSADYAIVKDVAIGGVVFQGLPIAFRDAPPFAAFGLQGKPALLLGMDALRQFRRVDIDFANREVRVSLPRRPR